MLNYNALFFGRKFTAAIKKCFKVLGLPSSSVADVVGDLGEELKADLDGNSEGLVPLFGVFGTDGRCCGGNTVK